LVPVRQGFYHEAMPTQSEPLSPFPDRRRCRSSFPYEAIGLFLSSMKRRARLRAITLGDEDGLVVAGAGRPRDLEFLAVCGALSGSDRGPWRDEIDAFAPDEPFFSLRLELDGACLLLSGVGQLDRGRVEVESALRRILDPSHPPESAPSRAAALAC
jgi:hypothetical protein